MFLVQEGDHICAPKRITNSRKDILLREFNADRAIREPRPNPFSWYYMIMV